MAPHHSGPMIVHAMPSVVQVALQRAADVTGIDLGFMLGTARRESGYNPAARAPTSSAAGLFQFVDQSWLAAVKKHGARYGYARYAALIDQGPDGRWRPAGAKARQVLMSLRLDPHASALMAGEMAAEHATWLRGRMGRYPTAGELYVAHFLGVAGSARLIEAVSVTPSASAPAMFPQAARANPTIFYRDGRAASLAEVYGDLTTGARTAAAPRRHGDDPFLPYAAARRAERASEHRRVAEAALRRASAAGAAPSKIDGKAYAAAPSASNRSISLAS